MIKSFAAPQAYGKVAKDKIFGAVAAAKADIAKFGKDIVVDGTAGAIQDDEGKLVCLPEIEKQFRALPTNDIIAYAPIAGLPDYIEKVQIACFGESRPDAYTDVIATVGGAGGIHHAVHNYTAPGDTVITSGWFWAAYRNICEDNCRKLATYEMLDEQGCFNTPALEAKMREVLANQDNLLVIINTPAHNPTGYSLTVDEMKSVVAAMGKVSAETGKKIILFIDAAYLDFAGEKEEVRKVFSALSNLPDGVFAIVEYSMSKGFTMYGQRIGAMIGVANNEETITEFKNINSYTSRATWSNVNRAGMQLLVNVYSDPQSLAKVEEQRDFYYKMIKARADVFVKEAAECGLKIVPYKAGFFGSIPSKDSDAVCEKLHADHVFLVPLAAGVRVALCSIPLKKIPGLAAKIKKALDAVEG